jgi:hypothetical protein
VKILVDITHPAHVHFFKHAIWEWQSRGHQVLITGRDKDLALRLLNKYEFDYIPLTRASESLLGLGFEMLKRDLRLWQLIKDAKPSVLVGIGGTFIAPVGKLTNTPVVVFTDTEHAKISNAITFPLADVICTPSCYEDTIANKQLTYDGYHELAYLHPSRFNPDPAKLKLFDVSSGESYIFMRLVAWASGHDIGDHGFVDVKSAVELLSRYGRVLISSEKSLPAEIADCAINAAPEHIHHLLAFASLYIGESATMASESALLGVPSILVSTSSRGYTNEQAHKYGLLYSFSDMYTAQERAIQKAVQLLRQPNLDSEWQNKRDKMLEDMIDVTDYVVDIVEKNASL